MRVQLAPTLVVFFASLWVSTASAQAYGGQSNGIANAADGAPSYRVAPTLYGASTLSLMHRHRCALKPSEATIAEKLATILVARARAAWSAAEHEPPASREAEIERILARALERDNECTIITQRAVWLARQAFSQVDPTVEAFDHTLKAMDVADRGASGYCECPAVADRVAQFGGPPMGDSGGGGGGVTHPPVAAPQ